MVNCNIFMLLRSWYLYGKKKENDFWRIHVEVKGPVGSQIKLAENNAEISKSWEKHLIKETEKWKIL